MVAFYRHGLKKEVRQIPFGVSSGVSVGRHKNCVRAPECFKAEPLAIRALPKPIATLRMFVEVTSRRPLNRCGVALNVAAIGPTGPSPGLLFHSVTFIGAGSWVHERAFHKSHLPDRDQCSDDWLGLAFGQWCHRLARALAFACQHVEHAAVP